MCQAIIANGTAFQELFWDVMKSTYRAAFSVVAPQGSLGDGGNDGYHTAEMHYYQVFSPIDPIGKIGKAAAKLKADFAKVLRQWGGTGPGLKKFSYVFNDKYTGLPKQIEQELNALRANHPSIEFAQYCCRDLETDFMKLDLTEWDRILGHAVPDPDRITKLDFGALTDVIRHIMGADVADTESRLQLPPELGEKISLNGLSQVNAIRIESGALLTGRIEQFIRINSIFALDELRDHVVGVYEAAKTAVAATPSTAGSNVADSVFTVFRRQLAPKIASGATMFAVDAVIGFFFEACDIFDPKAKKGDPGASP
ncbi:MAG: hypothetical protein JWP89_2342 [Schlesneria sp.]|nr:hypothetical protein [Schlesneria sp.]